MKYLVFIFVFSLFLVACESENEEDLFPPADPPKAVPLDTAAGQTISFSTDIQPLIQTNCATPGCHRANAQFPTLETYAQIDASKGRVKARVDQGSMPPSGPLQQTDKDKITAWINEGALNN